MRFLESDAASAQVLAYGRQEVPSGLDEGDAIDLARASGVAEVREERRARIRLHEHSRIGALKSREIADVRLPAQHVRWPGDEKRLIEERRQPLDSCHALRSSVPTRSSSASR
ncbi:MAG: hypothetical protein HW413_1739 [Thermoleophilia bacterium]|nr:hypothetical protein [Thermoleophilia bacterium]